jgi:hypothetical protein
MDIQNVDIIVDSVPNTPQGSGAGPGAGGMDMAFTWAPLAGLAVQARNASVALIHQGPGDNPSGNFNSTPDTDGSYAFTDLDVQVDGETGEGIVLRLTLRATTTGSWDLTLAPRFESEPVVYDPAGIAYDTGATPGGRLVIGSSCPAVAAEGAIGNGRVRLAGVETSSDSAAFLVIMFAAGTVMLAGAAGILIRRRLM